MYIQKFPWADDLKRKGNTSEKILLCTSVNLTCIHKKFFYQGLSSWSEMPTFRFETNSADE